MSDQEVKERVPGRWGGHMAGAICRRHPSLRPIDAYRHAIGASEDRPRTPEMEAGLAFEPGLLRLAGQRLKQKLRRVRPTVDPARDWLRAAPDAQVQGRDELVSAKWVGFYNSRAWLGDESDRVPAYVAIQEHVYMAILGCSVSHVFATVGGRAPRYYAVPFRERLWGIVLERMEDFRHRYVEHEVPPPPDGSEAFDRFLSAEVRATRGEVRPATAEEVALCLRYRSARLAEKTAGLALAEVKQELRLAIGEWDGIETPDGVVSCRADRRGVRAVRVPSSWDGEETER